MQYSSQAVVAVSVLQPEVVRHIELCFTKKGMKEMRPGRKKRAYPKRSEIIKIPADCRQFQTTLRREEHT